MAVLLNLLIAIMTDVYSKIMDDGGATFLSKHRAQMIIDEEESHMSQNDLKNSSYFQQFVQVLQPRIQVRGGKWGATAKPAVRALVTIPEYAVISYCQPVTTKACLGATGAKTQPRRETWHHTERDRYTY